MIEYKVSVGGGKIDWRNQNDELHRLDGPAVEYKNGMKVWYVNGKIHRLDGPAIERANGRKEWWIDGVQYSEEEFNKKIKKMKSPCEGRIIGIL